jgi:selenide,water dikinase
MPIEAMVQVLRRLPRSSHPDLLVGNEHFDDAGVYRINADTALVQTLDFFPPLIDDPFDFGRIAAANALSDVYAMGGEPLTAMNIVGFPDEELPAEILIEILRGGYERVSTAGAVIVGGHSVRDREIKYGLSVTGVVHPQRILTNAGARPGDALVLTKPIGSGVLTTAAKKNLIGHADLADAVAIMIELNRGARDAAIEAGVQAATDVTGFGLVGHAFEMADASGVTLEIDANRVPLMARTLDFARQGVVTRAHKATLAHVGPRLSVGDMEPALVKTLCDAQTSGGLLLCVSLDALEKLLSALQRAGTPCAAVIGRVVPAVESSICLK